MITDVRINGAPIDPCHILANATVLHGRAQFGDPGQASSAQIVVEYPAGPMPAWQSGDTLTLDTPEGVLFSGRIVERSLTHLTNTDGTRTGQFTATAAGPLAALGIRMVGDVPWPQEPGTARADKILTAAAVPYRVEGSAELQVLARDVDAQPALGLLDELAGSTGATVFDTPDGHVVYQTMQERSRPVDPYMWGDFPPGDTWDDFHPDLMWDGDTYNLLTANQASVETDITGFTTAYAPILTSSTDRALHGSRSLKVESTTANILVQTHPPTPVNAGQTYTAVWSIYGVVGSWGLRCRIIFRDAQGVVTLYTPFTYPPNNPAGWSEVRIVAEAPPTTVEAILYFDADPGVGPICYVDRYGLWAGSGGVWAMPGSPITLSDYSLAGWPSPSSTWPVVLPSCTVLWEPEWHSSEGAVINHVRIGYGPADPQAYVDLTDAASITQHGARYLYQGTQLATVADANARASHIITTQAVERWEIGDVVVALDQLDAATYSAVFDLLCGDPVTLQGMPQPAPATDWTGILEGWTYTMDGAGGALTESMVLALSDPLQSLMVMAWQDYPATYLWSQHPAHLTWFDLDSIDVLEAV